MLRPFFLGITMVGLTSALSAQDAFQFVSVDAVALGGYLQISWTTSLPSNASVSCDIRQGNKTRGIVFDPSFDYAYDHSVTIAVASSEHYTCTIAAADAGGHSIIEVVKDTGKRSKLEQ